MSPSRSSRLADAEVLLLHAVSRQFGRQVAVAPLTMTVGRGAVGVVVGDNGAGKTTLLRLAAGLLRPSTGTRRCSGRAVYLRPGSGARADQRVHDVVAFAAGATGSAVDVAAVLDRVGLGDVHERRAGTLSAGQRARLSLALAGATAPALACLDEPTASLDDDGRERTAAMIRGLADAGTAVLVATHDDELARAGWDVQVRLSSGAVVT